MSFTMEMLQTWEIEIKLRALLTYALDGGEWSASRPSSFTPREKCFGTYQLRDWMDRVVNLDVGSGEE
jgi:hypothetical protein